MSLTLVQLAQAIEDGKTIEVSVGGGWFTSSKREILAAWCNGSQFVRIKPEPREFWLVPYADKLGYKVCETHHSQWAPEVNVAGINFAGIIHVREVL